LLGHSWGGYLVMAYAAVHPDRIAHLIVVDSLAPRTKDSLALFDDVFPEGTERQAAVAFADAMGDKAASYVNIHEYLSMLFYRRRSGIYSLPLCRLPHSIRPLTRRYGTIWTAST
jgi:pimeloyl-ACP methyl ester carboxylesterase